MNMFLQHFLGKKKSTFLACDIEQVCAAIFESSKINDLFQNRQICSRQIFEISRNFLDMVSVRLHVICKNEVEVKTKTKMEGIC